MSDSMTKLGAGGRLIVPAAYRKALGVVPGDDLVLILEDEELRVMTIERAIKRAQAVVREYIPEGTRLSDELIADRRREAERE